MNSVIILFISCMVFCKSMLHFETKMMENFSEHNITWEEYLRLFPLIEVKEHSKFHFLENLKYIIEHNSVERSYKLGITPFMHLSDEEWKSKFYNITLDREMEDFEMFEPLNLRSSTPSSWDWREHGVVTPVKSQGSCGSCYSFSATETVETAWAIKSGELKVLSPQQIVDCSKLNSGCNGGLQSRVYIYLEGTQQCLESDYPYVSGNSGKATSCHSCKGTISTLSSYKTVKSGDENAMLQAVLTTSLAIAIEADQKQFQMYKSGVLDFDCGKNLDHAVTIEGYGSEDGKDYWLVRNSWDKSWGDNGYVKMVRNKDLCGLSQSVVFPVF